MSETPYWTTTGTYPVTRALFQGWVLDVVLGRVLVRELVHDVEPFAVRVVDGNERLPLIRERIFGENRLDRTLRFACAAVDALLRIDHQDPVRLVNAVDGAHVDAREVFDVDAGLGDDVGHWARPTLLKGDFVATAQCARLQAVV